MCKKDENGSPWFYWPFGARAISYRWESLTDGNAYKYLYLQSNPVVWAMGLLGICLAVLLLLAQYLVPTIPRLKHRFLLSTFTILYVCFLIAVSRIERVMYLYHYFLPLLFTFMLFALVFDELEILGKWRLTEVRKTSILLGLAVAIFFSYQFYRPLSYYEPLTDKQFQSRSLLRIWDLTCVRCQKNDPLVVPST
jgi:dolichyl-phosphate-mannose--protein O-mannosyl transferase